ncbi:MAG TPA: hypothetical protein PKZ42_08625 [Syntrophales bacterium]|nr:hypothetical protein [Syntrophales bacterium]
MNLLPYVEGRLQPPLLTEELNMPLSMHGTGKVRYQFATVRVDGKKDSIHTPYRLM